MKSVILNPEVTTKVKSARTVEIPQFRKKGNNRFLHLDENGEGMILQLYEASSLTPDLYKTTDESICEMIDEGEAISPKEWNEAVDKYMKQRSKWAKGCKVAVDSIPTSAEVEEMQK